MAGAVNEELFVPVTRQIQTVQNNYYYSGDFTGIGQANVDSNIDLYAVQGMIEQTVQEMFPT